MPKEANAYFESEREHVVLTQDIFSYVDSTEAFVSDIEALEGFLMTKDCWESQLIQKETKRSAKNRFKTEVANDVFEQSMLFVKNIDAVQVFDTITSFYGLHAHYYFTQLKQKYRKMLITDLLVRLGVDIEKDEQQNQDAKVQNALKQLF